MIYTRLDRIADSHQTCRRQQLHLIEPALNQKVISVNFVTNMYRYGFGLAMVLLGVAASQAQAAGCTKTVRWNQDPPYFTRGGTGDVAGIDADIVREALRRMACKPVFSEMPWARALLELEMGRLDILPGAFKTPEREEFAFFSVDVNRSPNVLFMSARASVKYRFERLVDVASTPFRLGAQIKVSYGDEFDALMAQPAFAARVVPLTHRASAWKMMQADRLDGVIADQVTGIMEIQQLGMAADVVKTRIIVSGDAAKIAFSRKSINPAFVEQFNKAFESMKTDGTYRRILEAYLPCKVSAEKLGCE